MALGFASCLGAIAVLSQFTAAPWWLRAAVLGLVLLVVGRYQSLGAAAFTGLIGWLCVEGFLLGHEGELRWHGLIDVILLVVALALATVNPLLRRR